MPIYEYKCRSCDHVIEVIAVGWPRGGAIHCEKCSGQCNRVMSAPGVIRVNGYSEKNGYSSGGS